MLRLVQQARAGGVRPRRWAAAARPPARQAGQVGADARLALKRVIPCLDVDAGRVVKGTNFVDLRDAGDPVELAARYDAEGADELVFLDITASHEKRDTITELARRTADKVFIPFTIGGGIRSVDDAQAVLDAGADKVAVNSAALARPELIGELAERLRLAVRGDRDRRQEAPRRPAAAGRSYVARRAHAGRGSRRRGVGARGGRARGGGGAADQHGPRRHQRRLRPRADPRGRRRGRRAGDRLGRRRASSSTSSRASRGRRRRGARAPRSSTTASTRSPRRRRRCARPGSRSVSTARRGAVQGSPAAWTRCLPLTSGWSQTARARLTPWLKATCGTAASSPGGRQVLDRLRACRAASSGRPWTR